MSEKRYTICVDFDGVIHSYTSGWQGADVILDPPVPGAIEWLNEMVKRFEVVIFTTRADQEGANLAIGRWLNKHGLNGTVTITSQKKPALVYIDDRAFRFDGVNFPSAQEVHEMIPWWKQPDPSQDAAA